MRQVYIFIRTLYNRAKSADSAFSLINWVWWTVATVTGLSGAAMLAWASSTWSWYWTTFSWAGVGFVFLIAWILFAVGFFLISLGVQRRSDQRSSSVVVSSDISAMDLPTEPIKSESRQWITFITNINIAAGLTPQTLNPVLLIGKAALNEKRLRVIVAHSHYATGMGWGGWTDPRQVELADLRDVISGQQVNISIVSCKLPADTSTAIMWGKIDGLPIDEVRKGTTYRVQIRIIGADGVEQQPIDFLLIRTTANEPPYLVNITQENEFSFAAEWTKKIG